MSLHASGSIPACAGEPPRVPGQQPAGEVYPRVCGGTSAIPRRSTTGNGLSPRVRGNPKAWSISSAHRRSIPACAGEPPYLPVKSNELPVYPRVCGGTPFAPRMPAPEKGLSPRVRGNHEQGNEGLANKGSIPACAGEPSPPSYSSTKSGVYPRVCGGTAFSNSSKYCLYGLSPRVRGNLPGIICSNAMSRSIPACAGEPPSLCAVKIPSGVYPRVCGGTVRPRPSPVKDAGLSPRVRGNPRGRGSHPRGGRSIPACAGEPAPPASASRTRGVYPRVCGGTPFAPRMPAPEKGLSPRVRGNLEGSGLHDGAAGSIPACAGEPDDDCSVTRRCEVYPRVCGGTWRVAE